MKRNSKTKKTVKAGARKRSAAKSPAKTRLQGKTTGRAARKAKPAVRRRTPAPKRKPKGGSRRVAKETGATRRKVSGSRPAGSRRGKGKVVPLRVPDRGGFYHEGEPSPFAAQSGRARSTRGQTGQSAQPKTPARVRLIQPAPHAGENAGT